MTLKAWRHSGFTLTEVLVVLVTMSLTITFVAFGFERMASDRLEKQAGEMSGWLQNISDTAVLNSAIYGASMDEDANQLRPVFYANNKWWQIANTDDIESLSLRQDITLQKNKLDKIPKNKISELSASIEPDMIFFPSGMAMPEEFVLSEAKGKRSAQIQRNEDGIFSWQIIQ